MADYNYDRPDGASDYESEDGYDSYRITSSTDSYRGSCSTCKSSRCRCKKRRDKCGSKCGDKCKCKSSCKSKKSSCVREYPHNRKYKCTGSSGCKCSKCCYPKYCCETPWPPRKPCKKGEDVSFGDVEANDITSDTVSAPPKKLYIPGVEYSSLNRALRGLKSTEEGGPVGGYHLVLRNGYHKVDENHNLTLKNLILEAASWNPTLSNPYIQGHGHAHFAIQKVINYYNWRVGGLGPYRLETCGDRVTVCSGERGRNPNFNWLCCGDVMHWRNKCNEIICYAVREAKCNTIWIKQCFDKCQPSIGEGFWIGNRSTISFRGRRQLYVSSNGNLSYRGLGLRVREREIGSTPRDFLASGSPGGVTELIHCHVDSSLALLGDLSSLFPCIFQDTLRLPSGSSGTALYHGYIGAKSGIRLDQSLVIFGGIILLGADLGLVSLGSAAGSLEGSTAHQCKTAAQILGGTMSYLGTIFSNNEVGIDCQAGGRIFSTTGEFSFLSPPLLTENDKAYLLKNKASGISDKIIAYNNVTDLTIDDVVYAILSSYPSDQFEQFASTLRYTEHIIPPSS